jgi:ankyrin repeat protein
MTWRRLLVIGAKLSPLLVVLSACGSGAPDLPLLDAIDQHNLEAVQQHIDAGTNINLAFVPADVDFGGASALHVAVLKHNSAMMQLLIENDVDLNIHARDTFGGTPLEWTAFFGLPMMTELLIAAGADVNRVNYVGTTPLDAAIVSGAAGKPSDRAEVAAMLKAAGAVTSN